MNPVMAGAVIQDCFSAERSAARGITWPSTLHVDLDLAANMSESCVPHHDWFTASLSAGICTGLIVSYLPQHLRIIQKRSSEGFSPWFLLLGSTSAAAGMLNMLTLQWGVIKCCRVFSIGTCIEMTAGVVQTSVSLIAPHCLNSLVLYMVYYPAHLKYSAVNQTDSQIEANNFGSHRPVKPVEYVKTDHWALSIILTWVVAIHFLLVTFVTISLLINTTPQPTPPNPLNISLAVLRRVFIPPLQVQTWATFLGVSSAVLAAIQYAPQIYYTYHTKLVGALSIKMMLIQTPGTAFMVLSIALRPGTDWTSWIMFAVSGVMQGTLLVLCIAWTFRQRRLGIDDFGRPLDVVSPAAYSASEETHSRNITGSDGSRDTDAEESTPLLPAHDKSRGLRHAATRLGRVFNRSHRQ